MSKRKDQNLTSHQSEQKPPSHLRNWVNRQMTVEAGLKKALARYIVTHHVIKFGNGLLIGSGTGPIILMSEIIEDQCKSDASLDLAIVTNNMQVFYLMRDARQKFGPIFGDTQVSLTAGTLRPSLDSLIGRAAEQAIRDPQFYPDTIIFGAKNITFQGGLKLSYQFEDELGVQEAFASRPTTTRILIADHTKFGVQSTYQAKITIQDLIRDAQTCFVLTTVHETAEAILAQEERALQCLLEDLASQKQFDAKEFVFRLIYEDGRVCRELTLSDVRRRGRANRAATGRRLQARLAVVDSGLAPAAAGDSPLHKQG